MAGRGVHFALTAEECRKLLRAEGNDAALIDLINEEIEERWDKNWLVETDKAWDGIHRSLSGGTLYYAPETTRDYCVLGGKQLYQGDDFVIAYLGQNLVSEASESIEGVTRKELKIGYEKINSEEYEFEKCAEDFEYVWHNFGELREFFRKARIAKRPVIFTVDI